MSTIQHHAIIVTAVDAAHGYAASRAAEGIGLVATRPFIEQNNYRATFVVYPDGSKEEWPESAEGDERRAKFRSWLTEHGDMYRWAEVSYGDLGARVEHTSERDLRIDPTFAVVRKTGRVELQRNTPTGWVTLVEGDASRVAQHVRAMAIDARALAARALQEAIDLEAALSEMLAEAGGQ